MPAESYNGPVTLVATHTIDVLPAVRGRREEVPGGPALYTGTALNRLGRPYRLITGARARVDVLPGQEYVIPALPPIPLPTHFDTDVVIVAPIGCEVVADQIPEVHGILAVDVQGFVRQPGVPSDAPIAPVNVANLLGRASVVKASEQEIDRLDATTRRALENTVVLISRSAHGLTLRWEGREHNIRVQRVAVPNTIGAGDTLLAGYVSAVMDGIPPIGAAELAVEFTVRMLRERALP